jgi:transposase-like protein
MNWPTTLLQAIQYFADEQNCIDAIAEMRWPDGVACPHCEAKEPYWLDTQKRWKCRSCRKQFSVKRGTIFEDSPIRLQKWLPALWMLTNCKNGISSYEVARDLGVSQKTAWFILHRLRLVLRSKYAGKIGGNEPIEVDETFVGGAAKNMHRSRRIALKEGLKGDHKTIVMGMLDRESRQVRAQVIPNVKRETLQNAILSQVEGGSTVYTDGYQGYDNLAAKEYIHATVNHVDEYVRGQVHTQGIENF